MVVDFQKIDKFTAFTTAFEIQKYKLSKEFNLSFDEMYDILFDDYLDKIMDRFNPHQAFCFCKKRFRWVLLDYVKKKPMLYDFSKYCANDIEYGKYKKLKKEPNYHTNRLGKSRGYEAGRPRKPISMFFKGKHIRDFESIAEATKYMGLKKGQICQAIRRKIKCHNYEFRYKILTHQHEDKGEKL